MGLGGIGQCTSGIEGRIIGTVGFMRCLPNRRCTVVDTFVATGAGRGYRRKVFFGGLAAFLALTGILTAKPKF